MAERLKEKIIESDKMVDVVCGPDTYRDLPRLLEAVDYGKKGRKRKKGQNHSASALVSASNVIGTAVASSLMDKQGRKSLLITSFMGMAASMLLRRHCDNSERCQSSGVGKICDSWWQLRVLQKR
jgi:hypothetical protein